MRGVAPLEIQAADDVAEMLQYRSHIFCKLHENEDELEKLLSTEPSPQMNENFLMVLRRWNSYTPSMVIHNTTSKGGGYFLAWNGVGVVIDPGYNFIEHFHQQGLRIKDIESIVVTHAHLDHCVELESLLTLLYEYNDKREKEAKERDKNPPEPKKINLYMNLGAFKKLGSWITSCHKDVIHKIHMLEAPVKKPMLTVGNAHINIKSAHAIHREIWSDEYSVGLIFELFDVDAPDIPAVTIGITSDTRWDYEVQEQYRDCELLVFHLGGIKQTEIFSTLSVTDDRRLYGNHLGAIGTTLMLHNMKNALNSSLKLAVISEFGEELKGLRKEITDLIRGAVQKHIPDSVKLNCVIGDVGTKIMLPHLSLMCQQKDCNEEAELEDVVLRGGLISHFCQKHMPIVAEAELIGLL